MKSRLQLPVQPGPSPSGPTKRRMREFITEHEMILDCGIEEVFAFVADAEKLPLLKPDWIDFRIVTPRPIAMSAGALIDYAIRLHGVRFAWQSEISVWEPPHRFVDEQRRGPFRRWAHTHTFEEIEGGQTLMRDVIRYSVPGGALIDRLLVAPDLRKIFAHRRRQLEEIFRNARSCRVPQRRYGS